MPENFTKIIGRLKLYLDFKGYTFNQLAVAIGVSNSYFSKMLKSNGSLGEDITKKILLFYDEVNPEWLILGKGSMLKKESKNYKDAQPDPLQVSEPQTSIYRLKTDYYGVEQQVIPLYEIEASAGLALLFSDQAQQVPLDHIVLPNAPKCDGAMYIRGDSMYPLLKAGDIACYKTLHNIENVVVGEKYILDISNGDDDFLTIKYVQKSEKGDKYFKLVSENKHHADKDIHISTIRALAIVKATIRFETLA